MMKTINVVAAIIVSEKHILAMQRGYGSYKGKWEFPGGKIEKEEAPKDALVREIAEELGAQITITRFFKHVSWVYPEFKLEMDCFLCELVDGAYTLLEHKAALWLNKESLMSVDWLPADDEVLIALRDEGVV